MVRKKVLYIGLFILIIFLTACSGTAASEKIYNHLEEAVELEQPFENQQDAILTLEQEEQEIYSEIMNLGMDEFDQIKELSEQALNTIESRREKIGLEEESIEASKAEFSEIESVIADLEEQDAKETADEMYDVMMDRFNAYDNLHDIYTETLTLEEELYTMLQDESLEQETLSNQINSLNDSYQQVIDANEEFNSLTAEYNGLKEDFYKAAGIDVDYDNNETEDKESSSEDSDNS